MTQPESTSDSQVEKARVAEKGDKVGAVMVVGGGISGMQSALDLADGGFKVFLVESGPGIGGAMAQLDKTFPTNDCSMCIMAPKLVSVGRHHNVELITNAELESVEGEAGNFRVTLKKHTMKVNEEKCTGCGTCAQKCPVETTDEYNENLRKRTAIFVKYAQAVPLVYSIDQDTCIGCGICAEECKAGAIEYSQENKVLEIDVGSIIVSPGIGKFDPHLRKEYGYGVYKNVVSSIDFERLLSSTGPHAGMVLRPSDGRIPERVAFIQCVGSRDEKTNKYCSAVCCMFSLKEAIIAKEHFPQIKPHLFFMDVRAYGKEFEKYYVSAEKEHGIKITKNNRISEVREVPETKNLRITYIDNGNLMEEEFDMVVLGAGLVPPDDAEVFAHRLKINLNNYNFAATDVFSPLETNRPGIFVGGAFTAPKDIPDTVAQASGAAAKASGIVSSERNTLTVKKEYPEEKDVIGQESRIGVFICHCGINIGSVVNVPEVVEYAKTLPNVVYATDNLYTCSQDTQEKIKELIEEHDLNRVIVASCTPRTHEPLFQNTCQEAGLNAYLFEMANIREHCSWVHMHEPEKATEKAKDLVRMALAKARLHEPLQKKSLPVTQKALVIGGGYAGMTAAYEMGKQGFETYLVEKESELGGNLRKLRHKVGGKDPLEELNKMTDKVNNSENVKVYTGTEVEGIEGFMGNFKTKLSNGEELEHGVVIVATGAVEHKPSEYMYGENDKVMTQLEFESNILSKGNLDAKTVVFIQCVGSRCEENPNCSRICCTSAMTNALEVKKNNPNTAVYVLFRDIRTYGFREDYYREAAEKGVHFIRFEEEQKPEVTGEGQALRVKVHDNFLNLNILLEPDYLVLNSAVMPNPDNEKIAQMLKVPTNEQGFFLEAHMKLRPVDFATEGVFVCGLAHGPKFISESISQACGAVARAATVLSTDKIEIAPIISEVIDENCDGCAYCIDPCPYDALTLIEYMKKGEVKKTVERNEAACKGCGVCMATCPKKGITVKGFSLEQLGAMVDAALEVA